MIDIEAFSSIPTVYKFTCLVNGKIYVGESLDFKNRLRQHKSASTDGHFHRAIRKHGWGNFEVETLHEFTIPKDESSKIDTDLTLLALETAFIDFYKSDSTEIGYNRLKFAFNRTGVACSDEAKIKHSQAVSGERNGFYGKVHTEETKKTISEKAKERLKDKNNNPMYGKKLSAETKEKISKANKGKASWNLGIKQTEETKRKISKAMIGKYCGENHPLFGKPISEETKRKIGLANTGKIRTPETRKRISETLKLTSRKGPNNPMFGRKMSQESINKRKETLLKNPVDKSRWRKSIRQIDSLTGEVIKIWDSADSASVNVGVSASHIGNVCRKQKDSCGRVYKTAKGFKWEFVNPTKNAPIPND